MLTQRGHGRHVQCLPTEYFFMMWALPFSERVLLQTVFHPKPKTHICQRSQHCWSGTRSPRNRVAGSSDPHEVFSVRPTSRRATCNHERQRNNRASPQPAQTYSLGSYRYSPSAASWRLIVQLVIPISNTLNDMNTKGKEVAVTGRPWMIKESPYT